MARPELTRQQWWDLNTMSGKYADIESTFTVGNMNALASEGCIRFHEQGFEVTPRGKGWIKQWRMEQAQQTAKLLTESST